MAVPLNPPGFQYTDNNGDPLAFGLVYTYEAGTLTPKATYTDAGAGTPNDNPVELDSSGRAPIWISGTYQIIVKTAGGVTIDTQDNVPSFAAASSGTTVTDSGFTVQNASDLTKEFRFDLSGLTTGTETVGKVPDGNFTFASLATIATAFKNKVLNGLIPSNGTDATNDLDFTAGTCISDDGTTIITPIALTKRLDAAWTAGTGGGGLDTGSIADTTYHVFAISKAEGADPDILFSASLASPTLPTNYTKKKRIFSFKRVSGAIQVFQAFEAGDGLRVVLTTPPLDIDVSNLSTSSVTYTLSTPVGISVWALINVRAYVSGGNASVYIRNLSSTDTAPASNVSSATNAAPIFSIKSTGGFEGGSQTWVQTNTSSQIGARSSVSSTALGAALIAWVDPR